MDKTLLAPDQRAFNENNFDLIRLFAALQVVTFHVLGHMEMTSTLLFKVISYFPGVPIFFFVSGFLIPRSLEKLQLNTGANTDFLRNRILRLYPALWICFLVSVLSVYFSGYFGRVDFSLQSFGIWAIAQNSMAQFYNPDFLRGYGTGVLNGSLWTITVELQFYLLTPLIVFLCQKKPGSIAIAIIVFAGLNLVFNASGPPQSVGTKLIWVSFVPWIYMFLLGYLVATSERLFQGINRFPLWAIFAAFCLTYYATESAIGGNNYIHPAATIPLCCLIIKIAYQMPGLSRKILDRTDISYGIYIYHMPVVNLVLFASPDWPVAIQIIVIYVTVIILASASWFVIEKPALRFKKRSMRTVK